MKNKSRIKYILLAFCMSAFLLLGSACSGAKNGSAPNADSLDPALFGKWKESYFDSSFVFNSDGTGEDTFWELPFTYSTDGKGTLTITFDDTMWGSVIYTYSVDGDTLTMQQEDSSDIFEYTRQ